MVRNLIQRLRSRGLVPAAIVTSALAVALLAPPVGAAMHRFTTTSYPFPCTANAATASLPSPQVAGTAITITGTGTCFNPSPSYEFWYLPPGGGWQLVKGYSTSNTFAWNTTGAAAGVHTFSVWVHDASTTGVNVTGMGSYDAFSNTSMTITAAPVPSCASVTAVATPGSPQAAGTAIAVTATAGTCTHSTGQLYQFWYLGVGGSWQMTKDYSTSNVFNWNSTGALAGVHHFSVWIRDSASGGLNSQFGSTYDAFASVPYTITTPSCASVTLAAAPPSPIAHGTTQVVFTATPGTCTNPSPLYEFWYRGQGSTTWQLVRGYTTSATLTWNTTGALAGNHYWSVWIKDAASSGANSALGSTYDAFGPLTYVLS